MGRLSEGHKQIIHGRGRCSVPMWVYPGYPAGFCDKPAYGKQQRDRKHMANYVSALACANQEVYKLGAPEPLIPPDETVVPVETIGGGE